VLCCDLEGRLLYLNPAARAYHPGVGPGSRFGELLLDEAAAKGEAFLAAAERASAAAPSATWELPLRLAEKPGGYRIASFSGYAYSGQSAERATRIVIIGHVAAEQANAMQEELLALNSELSQAQREQRRQNRLLQDALEQQSRLLQTIRELSVPVVPIWEGVLLLPLIGNFDSQRAAQLTERLLVAVSAQRARFVILDVSGIAAIDTAVAQHLIGAAQSLRLLGAQPVLVGISPEIAQTIVGLGVQLSGFVTLGNLQHAVAYVLHKLGG
jgi:anti-anti-sigma regulatory factor